MTLRFRSALSALGGKTFLTLMTAWTLVAAGILGLILYSSAREDRVIALNRATDSYRKDLVYRRWAAQRGGVYVPADEKTPPNPYLKDHAQRDVGAVGDVAEEAQHPFPAMGFHHRGLDVDDVRAGLFQIDNMPPQALEPFLMIQGPTLLFPFLRRLIADITREGGFPPLLLDPIDFTQVYLQRQQAAANQNATA